MQCTFCYKHKEKLVRFKWILWDVENPTNEELENVTRHAKSLFNNKERGKSMITDKQGREWLLQKLYDDGWRYLVMDNYDNLYLTNEKPSMFDDVDEIRISSCETAIGITAIKTIFSELKQNECISIAEELCIIDWDKVPVDTPILVKQSDGDDWEKRHFAFYKNGRVYAWLSGTTSWTNNNANDTFSWGKAKIAEV
jgi:hypothetical protein